MLFKQAVVASFLLAASELVAGHGAITGAVGDQGGSGSAIGIDPTTPRDGTSRRPFQQDSTRFKGNSASTCGETVGAGDNEVETGTTTVMQLSGGTLPQISQGGNVQMTLHQVNSDGGGPYTCAIDATGTGTGSFTPIDITTNIPGSNSRNPSGATTDFPLNVAIPTDQTCTGTVAGQSNVCMVRCMNAARAGPFGGCVPVQMVAATAVAGGNTTTTTTTTASAAAADAALGGTTAAFKSRRFRRLAAASFH